MNRTKWQKTENKIRKHIKHDDVLDTNDVTGLIFNVNILKAVIGTDNNNYVSIPISHSYFKLKVSEIKKVNLKSALSLLKRKKALSLLKVFV